MQKYKRFLDKYFSTIGIVSSILITIVVLIGMAYYHNMPLDTVELEEHIAKLELLKEDFSNVLHIKDTTVDIYEDRTKVTFNGNEILFVSFFDNNGNYLNYEIKNNRITSDVRMWIVMLAMTFVLTLIMMALLEQILKLPIYIHHLRVKNN